MCQARGVAWQVGEGGGSRCATSLPNHVGISNTGFFLNRSVVRPRVPKMINVTSLIDNSYCKFFVGFLVLLVAAHVFMPLVPSSGWLPTRADVNSFLAVLWQIHAAIVGLSLVVVTIIVTIMANESDRARTWSIYSSKTKLVGVVWFNFTLLVSEGIAVFQTHNFASNLIYVGHPQSIVISTFLFFLLAVAVTGWLFTETIRFLDPDYVENIDEKAIITSMPAAIVAGREQRDRILSAGSDK